MHQNKPTAYLMVGIPGSGKTTWIKENLPDDVVRISRDSIRHKLGFTSSDDEKAVLSRADEELVTKHEYDAIKHNLYNGFDIVIDDINISKYRASMVEFLRACGANVVGVKMNTPLEVCVKRREGQIPKNVMKRIHDRRIDLKQDEVDYVIEVPCEMVK